MAAERRRVVWAQSARDALDEALGFIAERSIEGAERVLNAALEAASSLDLFAERGRVVPEIGDPTLREVFVFRFRLMYQVRDDEVHILAFVHGARDLRPEESDQ